MILSFAHTTPQFLAGTKSVTRRSWKQLQMQRWQRAFDQGKLEHDAYDKDPRAKGKKIGRFRLIARPYWEPLYAMPDADLAAEGFPEFKSTGEYIELMGADPGEVFAVIRFHKIEG